jgi:hypothetical protein
LKTNQPKLPTNEKNQSTNDGVSPAGPVVRVGVAGFNHGQCGQLSNGFV